MQQAKLILLLDPPRMTPHSRENSLAVFAKAVTPHFRR
jgi:hypothetical protein